MKNFSYEIILLNTHHIDDILKLQDIIINSLNNKDIFNASPKEVLFQNIQEKGRMIGIFFEKELIAYHSFYYPDNNDTDYNLGVDINLLPSEFNIMANIQNIVVHPDFRGNKLGLDMNKYAIEFLYRHKYSHILATVSPVNIHSLKLFFDSGFIIKVLKEKYGGKLRYIFYRNIQDWRPEFEQSEHYVSYKNIEQQLLLLKSGFCGTNISKSGSSYEIIYKELTWQPEYFQQV